MPKLIRLYIVNVLIGFCLAAVFVAMLLWFNVANLWHLVTHSDKGLLAVFLLWFSNGVIFAGVQFGIAVMRQKDDDDDEPRGGLGQHANMQREYKTIPVRAKEGRAPFWQKK